MRSTISTIIVLMISCLFTTVLQAQEQETVTYYNVVSYMKVKQGMQADYLKLEKAWKKLHEAKIKAGNLQFWQLAVVLSPSGSDQEYNFITRNLFKGDDQMANYYEGNYFPENWESLVTEEERALMERTNELRTIVKTEIWLTNTMISSASMSDAKIQVFNFFDFPEGKGRADHVEMEKSIWQPVHQARVDAGEMSGWVLLRMMLPYGAGLPYHDATVDVYKDMKQYLAANPMPHFEKVHPGKKIDDLMKKTYDNGILVRGEVRMRLDKTDVTPPTASNE